MIIMEELVIKLLKLEVESFIHPFPSLHINIIIKPLLCHDPLNMDIIYTFMTIIKLQSFKFILTEFNIIEFIYLVLVYLFIYWGSLKYILGLKFIIIDSSLEHVVSVIYLVYQIK